MSGKGGGSDSGGYGGGGRNARVGVKGSWCVYGETIRRVMVD